MPPSIGFTVALARRLAPPTPAPGSEAASWLAPPAVGDTIDRKALIRDAARVALGYAASPRRLAALLRERARPRTP